MGGKFAIEMTPHVAEVGKETTRYQLLRLVPLFQRKYYSYKNEERKKGENGTTFSVCRGADSYFVASKYLYKIYRV